MKVYVLNIEKLNQKELFQKAYELADDNRKKKVDACKRQEDKNRSLGAGLLLAYGLADALQISWENLKEQLAMEKGKYGKPYSANSKGICFNLSHSGSYAACAVSGTETPYVYNRKNEVGIDIQKVSHCGLKTGKRAFTEKEYKELEKVWSEDEKQGEKLFSRLWTEKESRGKLLGTGIFLKKEQPFCVYTKNYAIGEEYILSLADYKEEFPKEIVEVSLEELLHELE